MEYNRVLDSIISRTNHQFIIGENDERTKYLKSFSDCNSFDLDKKFVSIYIKDSFLNTPAKYDYELDIINMFHSRYFEMLVAFNIFDNMINSLSSIEIRLISDPLLRIINSLFVQKGYCVKTLNELRNVLYAIKCMYIDEYQKYLKLGEYILNSDRVAILGIELEFLIRKIKMVFESLTHVAVIIDCDSKLSVRSTQVINNYINSRTNSNLSIKVGCEENSWKTYFDQRGNYIQSPHDFSVIKLNDYVLRR